MAGRLALQAIREGALDWGDCSWSSWLKFSGNVHCKVLKAYKEPDPKMRRV